MAKSPKIPTLAEFKIAEAIRLRSGGVSSEFKRADHRVKHRKHEVIIKDRPIYVHPNKQTLIKGYVKPGNKTAKQRRLG